MSPTKPIHVLLVEDNPTDVLLAKESLSPLSQVSVKSADRLSDAVKMLARDPIDVILLDLGLPDSQGMSTLIELRRHSADCPVVVLTGNDDQALGLQALQHGAQDYVVKRDVIGMDLGRAVMFAMERSRMSHALEESEARHRQILDMIPDGVFVNTNDRITYCNPAFVALVGATSKEILLGKSPLTFFHPDFHNLIRTRIEFMQQQNSPVPMIEEEIIKLDGTIVPVEVVASPIEHRGKPSILVVLHDLRKRKDVEERFRKMVDGVKDYAIYSLGPTGKITSWNSGAERITGYSAAEATGMTYARFFTDEEATQGIPERELQKAATSGEVIEEGWRVRKDGSQYWANGVLTALFDRVGGLRAYLKVTRDLTERKQAEFALQGSEERFRAFMDNSPAAAWITDGDARFVYVSETYRKLFKIPDDILGKTVFEIFPHDVAQVHFDNIRTVAETGKTFEAFLPGIRVDGTRGEFQIFKFRLPSEKEILVGGTALDVTEQRRAETALRLRDRAMQAVSQGITITDPNQPDNPIVYASRGFEKMTEYAAEEVVGKNCRFLQGRDTDAETVTVLREAIRRGEECKVEILNYRKSGTSFWNAISVTPVRDEAGKLVHFVGVQSDMTERRKLEQALHQSQKMEAIGQLAGGVAHDFNNLLTVINGYSHLLLEKFRADDPTREFLLEIEKSGERAGTLTRQLLAFSRQQVLEAKVLDLNQVVSDIERLLRRLIEDDVIFSTSLSPTLRPVKADPGQIEQVVINLVVNARDAMPRGGNLTVETQNCALDEHYCELHPEVRPGEYVVLSISDTGHGFDEKTKARIFEPFFTTKGPGKGTGLGLATVHGIVKQSGGHISPYSEVGHGTVFKIYLPVVNEPLTGRKNSSGVRAMPMGNETVLLVEDEPAVRALAKKVLQTCGYTVLEATNGREALQRIESHPEKIHLLVSDVVMPYLGGRELAEQILLLRPDCKVLFLSGYTDDAVIRHGVLEADFAFLQKPFTPTVLAQKVRGVIDGVK